MAVITVNRVRIRRWWTIPKFAFVIAMICRQVRRTPGCLDFRIYRTTGLAVWTVTAWVDEESLLAFRDSGAHGRAGVYKTRWFDEASIARWHQATPSLPDRKEAAQKLLELGRLSEVCFPSSAQARGEIVVT